MQQYSKSVIRTDTTPHHIHARDVHKYGNTMYSVVGGRPASTVQASPSASQSGCNIDSGCNHDHSAYRLQELSAMKTEDPKSSWPKGVSTYINSSGHDEQKPNISTEALSAIYAGQAGEYFGSYAYGMFPGGGQPPGPSHFYSSVTMATSAEPTNIPSRTASKSSTSGTGNQTAAHPGYHRHYMTQGHSYGFPGSSTGHLTNKPSKPYPGLNTSHRSSPGLNTSHRPSPGLNTSHRPSPGLNISYQASNRSSPGLNTSYPGHEASNRSSPGLNTSYPGHEASNRSFPGLNTSYPGHETSNRSSPGLNTSYPGHEASTGTYYPSHSFSPSTASRGSTPSIDDLNVERSAKRARKTRTTFTEAQMTGLESWFERCQYPDAYMKEDIALQLNLKEEIIRVWFKNRRQKLKKDSSRKSV